MNTGGWIIMVLSVGGVTCLLSWCIYKVFAIPKSVEHLHSTADVEPPDIERDEP